MISAIKSNLALEKTIEVLSQSTSTPFYLLDVGGVQARFGQFVSEWRAFFPNVEFAYSYKTNPLAEITRTLRESGARAEVISCRELEWALSDGFKGNQIHFNGPVKTREALRLATRLGAAVHIDSLDELDLLARSIDGERPRIVLRMAHTLADGVWSRFGLTLEELLIAIQRLEARDLSPIGLHFHIGSNINSTDLHTAAVLQSLPLLQHLIAQNKSREQIQLNIGGGFPTISATGCAQSVTSTRDFAASIFDALRANSVDPTALVLVSEPGRVLVEDACILIARVVARKNRAGKSLVIVDTGLDLVRSAGAMHHSISFVGSTGRQQPETSYLVYGARCYENDRLPSTVSGPENVEIGALMAISSAGAYALTQASVWNGLIAPIYGIEGGQVRELARAGRFSELASSTEGHRSEEAG